MKNMVLATWERNNAGNFVWYPMFYDCDSMLGLNNEGYVKFDSGVDFQDNEYNTSNSRLWTKLRDELNYGTNIKERYHSLRDMGVLTAENILSYFEDGIINKIGEKYYNWDARLKYATLSDVVIDQDGNKITNQPGVNANLRSSYLSMCNGNRLEWTRRWLEERIVYMDSVYAYGDFMKSNIVLRSQSHTGSTTIKIKTYSPQRVTIRFSDANTTDSVVTMRCTRNNTDITATDGWYEFTGTILNAIDNNITIVGGHNVMAIGGLEEIDLASLKLSSAPKLTTLNIPGAKSLIELEVSNNYMLQEIDLSGCEKLGMQTNYQAIDLSSAKYLKKLDVSNTMLRSITVAPEGGVLEDFNISKSFVTSIILNKQPYLEELDLASCIYLSEVNISDCESMKSISIPGTRISKFSISDLPELTFVDISTTSQLSSFSAIQCPKLNKLVMKNITSPNIRTLDVSTCTGLTSIDITNSPLINRLRFHSDASAVKELLLSSSGIVDIQYGNADTGGWLDLSRFNLTSLKLNNCQSLIKVKGINLNTNSSGTFSDCQKLETVQGTIKLTGGGASNLFNRCYKLKSFPPVGTGSGKLDISGVTSASSMFYNARVTWAQAKSVLKALTKCQSFNTMFYYAICEKDAQGKPIGGFFLTENDVLSDDWKHVMWTLPEARNIQYMFSGCTIPAFELNDDFFMYNTKMTDMGHHPFPKIKGDISDKVFSYMPDLQQIYEFFSGCTELGYVDEYVFASNRELVNAWSCFSGCTNMDIKNANRYGFAESTPLLQVQTKLANVDNMFSGCKNLTGYVPGNIFQNCSSLTSAKNFFSGCSSLEGEIPANIFNYPGKLANIDSFFADCTKLSGPIRTNIWSTNNNIVYASSLFNGCTGLGGDSGNDQEIPTDFFSGKTKLSNIGRMFKNCTNLRFRLIDGWFNDLRDLNNINELFYNCRGLSGALPEKLFCAYKSDGTEVNLNITAAEGVFYNCSGLSGQIPRELFKYFTQVQSLNDFFRNCWRLTGRIPEYTAIYEVEVVWDEELQLWVEQRTLISEEMGLFDKCKELLTCARMFYLCSGIGKTPTEVTKEDPYAIPESMFQKCTKLMDCNNMFYRYQPNTDGTRVVNTLYGEVPPNLFRGLYQLENTSNMFAHQGSLTGVVSNKLFMSQDVRLQNTAGMFLGCNLTELQPCFLQGRHTGLTSVNEMFYGNGNMTGTAMSIINAIDYVPNHTRTFYSCTKLSDFEDERLTGWK